MQVKAIYDCLSNNGIEYYFGVPDSLLKDFCSYLYDNHPKDKCLITANEGNAIAFASGIYLSSNKPAVVYMQNSGFGNCINPLLSLVDENVYKIPMLMIIGWRGKPGEEDEPQHIKQGKVTESLLKVIGIEYSILPENEEEALITLNKAIEYMEKFSKPFAIIIKKGTFNKYFSPQVFEKKYDLDRETAIKIIIDNINENTAIVSTTGRASRELFEYRQKLGQNHDKDFLTVGGMGHASSIAAGIALDNPNRPVICLDGDGAFIMHMGAIAINNSLNLKNLKHIILNNNSHESVGGQPTCADSINFVGLAKSCSAKNVFSVSSKEELSKMISDFLDLEDSAFLEIKLNNGSMKDLGRPTKTPIENKENFMRFLGDK